MIPPFRIDPEFHGPTLAELMPILEDISWDNSGPLEVRWTGSPADYLGLERARLRKLLLVVPDLNTQERTIWNLDGELAMAPAEVETTMKTLFVKANQADWRKRLGSLNYARGTMLLCRIVSDTLKQGTKIRSGTVAIARECLLDHINPMDADVLLRLRNKS